MLWDLYEKSHNYILCVDLWIDKYPEIEVWEHKSWHLSEHSVNNLSYLYYKKICSTTFHVGVKDVNLSLRLVIILYI